MKDQKSKYILFHHTQRAGHWLGWRMLHLFFPGVVHYLTDKYQNRHHHLVVDTVYAITAITLLVINMGLAVWWTKIFTPVDLELDVLIPAQLVAYESTQVEITLQNGEEPVQDVILFVEFPTGLEPTKPEQLKQLEESDERFLTLELGSLQPHELQRVVIPSLFVGDIVKEQHIRTFVQLKHFNQAWQTTHGVSFIAQTSALSFSSGLPEHVLNDQAFDWTITYKNASPLPLHNVSFELTLPGDMVVEQVEGGQYISDTQSILLSEIQPESEGVITLTSVFHETFDSNKQISIQAVIPGHSGQVFSQGAQVAGADALRPRIQLAVTSHKSAVYLEETIYYTINVENIGDADLSDFVVSAELEGEAFEVTQAYGSGAAHSGSTLTWELAEVITPGGSTQLRFSVPTKASLTDHQLTVRVTVNAQALISDIQVKTISQSVSSEVKFNSNLSLTTVAVYTGPSGEQFGYGPWPLAANEITAVRIFWSVKNVNNQVNNTVMQTTLPDQVEWTGEYSVSYGAGLSYDEKTRTVSWIVGTLPADGRTLGASFEVRVLPNYLQSGQRIRLTNETSLTAIDAFTGVRLSHQELPVMTPDPVSESDD